MASTAAGIVVPAVSDAFDPQGDMVDLAVSLAGRVIVPASSAAVRDQIRTDAIAAGLVLGTHPLHVDQLDTGAIMRDSGSGWKEVARVAPYAATFALNSLWSPHSRGVSLTRIGGRWLLDVAIINTNAGNYTVGWAPLGTLPAEARTSGGTMAGGMCTLAGDAGFTPSGMDLDLAGGAVRFRITSSNGSLGAGLLEFHGQASWDA